MKSVSRTRAPVCRARAARKFVESHHMADALQGGQNRRISQRPGPASRVSQMPSHTSAAGLRQQRALGSQMDPLYFNAQILDTSVLRVTNNALGAHRSEFQQAAGSTAVEPRSDGA